MCKALLDTGASANFISKDVVQWYDAASFDNSTVTSQFGLITKTMARDNANYYHCIGIKTMRPKK